METPLHTYKIKAFLYKKDASNCSFYTVRILKQQCILGRRAGQFKASDQECHCSFARVRSFGLLSYSSIKHTTLIAAIQSYMHWIAFVGIYTESSSRVLLQLVKSEYKRHFHNVLITILISLCVVLGDLTQKWPHEDPQNIRANQLKDFIDAVEEVPLPISVVAGNHDLGNTPSNTTVEAMENLFGNLFYTIYLTKFCLLILNSPILFDNSMTEDLFDEQIVWIKATLETNVGKYQTICLMHHPLFLSDAKEDDEHMGTVYIPALEKVQHTFHGHLHYNHAKESGGVKQVVVTSCGRQLGDDKPGALIVKVGVPCGIIVEHIEIKNSHKI